MRVVERQLAIGLCGLSKSGKDYVAALLNTKRFGGFEIHNITDRILRPVAIVRNVPQDRDSLRRLLTKLDNIANEMLFTHVYNTKARRIVLPNVRLLSTIDFWKNKSGYQFYLGCVKASEQTRFRRYMAMKRDIDPTLSSIEQFRRTVDYKDLDVNELDRVLEREPDFVVENDHETDGLLALQLEKALREVVGLTAEFSRIVSTED